MFRKYKTTFQESIGGQEMKKKIIIGIALSCMLVGCGNTQTTSTTTPETAQVTETTTQQETTVEETTVPETTTEEAKTQDIVVTAIDKKSYDVDASAGRYQMFVEIVTNIQNNTDKDIKGIQGVYHIKDMFGEDIVDVNFDLTQETVPAGQTVTIKDYGLNINNSNFPHEK